MLWITKINAFKKTSTCISLTWPSKSDLFPIRKITWWWGERKGEERERRGRERERRRREREEGERGRGGGEREREEEEREREVEEWGGMGRRRVGKKEREREGKRDTVSRLPLLLDTVEASNILLYTIHILHGNSSLIEILGEDHVWVKPSKRICMYVCRAVFKGGRQGGIRPPPPYILNP